MVGQVRLSRTPHPLRSARITRLHRYYEVVRPCALRSVLCLSLVNNLRTSLRRPGGYPEAGRPRWLVKPAIVVQRDSRVGRGNLTPSRSQNRAYPSRSTRLVASMQPCPAADRPYELLPHTVVGPLRLPWTPRPLGSTRITELPSCRVGGGCGRTATSARPSELPVQFSRKQLSSGVPLLAVVAFHARDQFQEIDQAKFPVELGPR